MQVAIDTGSVTGRRALNFGTVTEALSDVDRLADAERAGTLANLGNWTLGRTLNHLATWAEYSFTGAPMKPPLFVKLFMRLVVGKKKFINTPMRAGVRSPGLADGTLGTEAAPTEQSLPRYRAAMQRLQMEAPTKPNILFGPLTHDEWIRLNLRHAELHL